MTYYIISAISISGEKEYKISEKEINWFLETSKKRGWKLVFIG